MNGVIVVDKPTGKTSFEVVREVQSILGVKKAGHTGTLDPLATGVLPICLNEATKLVQFLTQDTKDYRATMMLGIETDTLDIDGTILSRRDPCIGIADLERVLEDCVGEMGQIPPRYSAVKFQGRALHDWARKGVAVDLPPRRVEILRIELLKVEMPYVTFFVSCSKGTYIRSLCADIGDRLGCKACLAGLRRVRSGRFHEKEAFSIEELRSRGGSLPDFPVISMVDALEGFPAVPVDEGFALRLREGYQPTAGDLAWNNMPSLDAGDMVKFTLACEGLIAVGAMLYASGELPLLATERRAVRIARVFNG